MTERRVFARTHCVFYDPQPGGKFNCLKGVNIRAHVGGSYVGWLARSPCVTTRLSYDQVECDLREYPTQEEVDAFRAETDRRINALIDGVCPGPGHVASRACKRVGKIMTAPKSMYEAAGRAAKVFALCQQIRRELKGVDTDTGAQLVADFLRQQTPEWWLELAVRAGVKTAITRRKVPGPETREAVALAFEALAEDDPEREEPNAAELAEIARW